MPLTPTEVAYFAGLLDGEGSISLVRSFAARTRGRYVYPLIRVANTNRDVLEWVSEKFPVKRSVYVTKSGARCKDCYHVAWASNQAIEILKLSLPYLIIKRKQAELVLGLWEANNRSLAENGGYFGNGHSIPQVLVKIRETAFKRLQEMNRRGVNDSVK